MLKEELYSSESVLAGEKDKVWLTIAMQPSRQMIMEEELVRKFGLLASKKK